LPTYRLPNPWYEIDFLQIFKDFDIQITNHDDDYNQKSPGLKDVKNINQSHVFTKG